VHWHSRPTETPHSQDDRCDLGEEARRTELQAPSGAPTAYDPPPGARWREWLSALPSDLRLAARSAVRQPAFPAVVVATLALGIGANTAMFGVMRAALLRPLPFEDAGRLVVARSTHPGGRIGWLSSAANYHDYRAQATSFEVLTASKLWSLNSSVSGGGVRPERVATNTVSHDFFRALGVRPLAGRWFAPDEGVAGAPYVALVSERLARRRFGGVDSAVGRAFAVTGIAPGGVSATVVGVMPEMLPFPAAADMWVPMRRGEEDGVGPGMGGNRLNNNWVIMGRLKPGVSIEGAQRQVDAIAARLAQEYPETNQGRGLLLQPLQTALFGPLTPQIMLLVGAVGLVLLIACANVAGLLLARGAARRPEMAVRAALGASRGRLAGQLLSESLLLTAIAGLAGVAVAMWLQRLLPAAAGLDGSGLEVRTLDLPVLLFAAAVSAVTGLLFGIVPALRTSATDPATQLASGVRSTDTRAGSRLRGLLVVAQVAASLSLLVGAGALIRNFARLVATDVGFEADGMLFGEIALPYDDADRRIQFYEQLRQDVAALPGVAGVALASHVPLRDPAGDPYVWASGNAPTDPSQRQTALERIVTPGFFSIMRIPLVAGRDLSRSDRADAPPVMVINRLMARTLFPGQDPIGKHVVIGLGSTPTAYEVVGVVGDARIEAVAAAPRMTMYRPLYQRVRPWVGVMVRTNLDPAALTGTIRRLVESRDATIPFEALAPMERLAGDSLRPSREIAIMLGMFSLVALSLASLGLYGVLSYYVSQRTNEIGIRMALGADRALILHHVFLRSGVIVIPGLLLGIGASLAGARVLARLFPNLPSFDAATIVTAALVLTVVAAAASALPAWRAASIDPARAMRGE